MYRLCGGIDSWVEHGAGACVCMCVYMYISKCIACVVGVKCEYAYVLHGCFMGVCVCVFTCTYLYVSLVWYNTYFDGSLHVHIYMYCLCGGIDSWVEVRVRICFTCVFHRCLGMDS